ncbi:SusD/RagB family nutrient-binding outer membrane lipoprotein [Chitinophaga arvensicola]|uniref:Starch-binding associating with outer membrane n=1 Tax=Chitinophaga arvensicola TaxID=29529 RepID=A0A1I0PYF2_9BACT|nr:SusD/RagB family nutrient-binding outer membrane lipoprotein [Chitinophaga arvensicola]SEW19464.1 Starch-binding associating with outer membrane [Chitinophaga arvensicola]
MTKKIIISIIAGSLLFAGAGCKKFLNVNDDPSGAEKVNDGLLLTGVEMTTAFSISGGYPARTSTFWTQQLAYNQPAPDWDTYSSTSSDVNNTWAFDMYPAILKNLKVLEAQANEAGHKHFEGVAKIMIAYNLAVTTDVWNDVPYSEGFQGFGKLTPKYDSQKDIYASINTLLDDAITLLSAADNTVVPDAKDLIYGGKASKWVSFAYFLKARYALRLCYAPGNVTTTQAQAALTAIDKAFPDESGNAFVQFATGAGAESPWYQFIQNWGSVVTSKTFIDFLQGKNDPRLPLVAEPLDDGSFVGRKIGITATSPSGTVSEVGAAFSAADMKINLGTYDEQLFIKAEATFLTAGAAAAQPILKQAVEATMKRFGLDAASAEVQAYITANCTITPANAYATIMYEKYIANFQTLEAFNDWRRTNLPALTPVANAYLNLTTIPRRWVYPASENATNKQPQQPGLLTGRVWWDTKQ